MLKYHSGATLPPIICVVDPFVTAHGQNHRPERLEGKPDNLHGCIEPCSSCLPVARHPNRYCSENGESVLSSLSVLPGLVTLHGLLYA